MLPYEKSQCRMLILTTVPHFFSILPLVKYYRNYFFYINTIIVSTTLSILYHYYEESNVMVTILDYFFAFLWFVYDMYLACKYKPSMFYTVILSNGSILLIHSIIPYTGYVYTHSIWHLLSAYKCFYISSHIKTTALAPSFTA